MYQNKATKYREEDRTIVKSLQGFYKKDNVYMPLDKIIMDLIKDRDKMKLQIEELTKSSQ